jgi:hypothetical protein
MDNESRVPFVRRFGLSTGPLILEDFPRSARLGLWHVLLDLVRRQYIRGGAEALRREVQPAARTATQDDADIQELLLNLPWVSVYGLLERLWTMLTDPANVTLKDVQQYYDNEMSQLFGEEGIGYAFRNGKVTRPGRPSTQKAISRTSEVLSDTRLTRSAAHFRKALQFFSAGPTADYENAVKEAVAALEAAVKALLPSAPTAMLPDVLRSSQGTTADKIPPTLVKAMSAVFAFRGAADGVAHGGANGGVATPEVAEWVLAQVAAHITYLVDFKRASEVDVPF